MKLDFASDIVSSTPHLQRLSTLKPESAIVGRQGRAEAFWSGGTEGVEITWLHQ